MSAVLIIDRDATTRLAAQSALGRAGFVVSSATDDDVTVDPPPDLIIADPAIASLAMLRRRYPAARLLALTQEDDAAPDDLPSLRKPFTASQLLGAVRRCLARSGS